MSQIDLDFIKKAPKIELHAHLNGCVRKETLEQFAKEKNLQLDFSCFDRKDNDGQFHVFGIISQTIKTLPDFRRVTKEMLEDFKLQNVIYLEIRTTPKQCENGSFTMEEYVNTILEVIKDHNQQKDQTMQVRLLLSIDRGRSQEHAQKVFNLMLKMHKEQPYVVGLDFSGNPEKNSFSDFIKYFQQCKQLNIKTTLHAAVIDGQQVIDETLQMIEFQPDRVGHFNFFNKQLYDRIIQKKIPIELCPTSNFFTKGLKDMSEHHFKDFFFQGHLVSLSTDDTGVFDTDSTQEHQKIIKTFNLNKEQFKQLLINSSNMIFDTQHKEYLQQQIQQYFEIYQESPN
ncbi:adenosine/AMP deaminase (macronuclear) [Tetrahymena thermophila SB210]|uniref:Adenosine/AMP deaminase n=1 Tax=Tetrahymena thermophila (strain SB210) TaxID=312017 RepID=I7MMM7_TETTS|nr:adenosine/AMP deaminase [Tetrahymena thermophila SB210]EAS05987.1 adenosine/AMP deaminase [Tetrahymena thermophila SB210]|eukprot:XP_001026232.1 adenosine/AMP deaminase [Tetrahymena thermophila SB210]